MKDPMKIIERFCYKHPNFGIKNLMLYISVANIGVWVISTVYAPLLGYMSFNPALILRGQVWRLVTFIFYPPSTGLLAFIAFYFYYWIGSTLEQYWGTPQFNVYFFSGVVFTILYGFVIYFITGRTFGLNAQYIYLSMFFSFAALFPDLQVLLFFLIPVKMKYLAYVDAAFFALSVLTSPFPYSLLPVVAVLNFLIFCGGDLLQRRPPRASKNAVHFRREARRIRQEQRDKLYNHKCAVCGRTDTEFPDLEFRYCSRCEGFHCFCQEHINNHIHFTE